jgi:hypothetical protein
MKKGDLVRYNFDNIWCKRLRKSPLAAPSRGMLGVILKTIQRANEIDIFVEWVDGTTNWYFNNELDVIEEENTEKK